MRKENKQIFFLESVSERASQLLKQKRKEKKKQRKILRSQGIFPHQVNNELNSEANKGNLHKQDLQCHVPVAQLVEYGTTMPEKNFFGFIKRVDKG